MSQIVVRALRHHVLMAGLVRRLKHDADDSSRERNLNPKPPCQAVTETFARSSV